MPHVSNTLGPILGLISFALLCACANPLGDNAPASANAISDTGASLAEPQSDGPVWRLEGDGLRHVASGHICPAKVGDFALTGDEAYPGLPHGTDVACIYEAPAGGKVVLHLTDFGRAVSPSAHLKGTASSIQSTYETTGERLAPFVTGAGPITANTAAFSIAAKSDLRPDVPVDTAVWVERIGPWHIKARATYERDREAAVADLISALYVSARTHISPNWAATDTE